MDDMKKHLYESEKWNHKCFETWKVNTRVKPEGEVRARICHFYSRTQFKELMCK